MRRIKLLSILALMLFCAMGAKAELITVTWTDFSGEGAIYKNHVSFNGERTGANMYYNENDYRLFYSDENDYVFKKIEITCTDANNLSGFTGSAPTIVWEGTTDRVYFNGNIYGISKIVFTIERPVPVESIEFTEDGMHMNLGEKRWLLATVYPENADNKNVSFESSNPDVVVVSDKGLMEAVGEGNANIIASCGGRSASCLIIVKTFYQIVFKEGTKDTKNWYIAPNPTEAGRTITMTYYGKKKVKSIKAVKKTVDVSEVTLNKSSIELFPGKTELLKASIMPEYASDKNVTWTSSDPSVATVEYGLVKAVKRGFTTITATVGGKSATCKVTVPATLADALTDNLMVIIYFKYSSGDNKCSYYNVGGTFKFMDGSGDVVNNAEMNKELIIENGNLVFKVCPGAFDSSVWQTHGFQITFNPTNNTYKVWRGSELDTYNNDFDMIYVDFHCIDLTEE